MWTTRLVSSSTHGVERRRLPTCPLEVLPDPCGDIGKIKGFRLPDLRWGTKGLFSLAAQFPQLLVRRASSASVLKIGNTLSGWGRVSARVWWIVKAGTASVMATAEGLGRLVPGASSCGGMRLVTLSVRCATEMGPSVRFVLPASRV